METRPVYLDHNATTPLHAEVKMAMQEALELFGNPSSLHAYGRDARQAVEQARAQVAALINAAPAEILFVGSGSEANNTVLSILTCTVCTCGGTQRRPRGVVTTAIEHPCVLETAKCLAERGTPAAFAPVDAQCRVDAAAFEALLAADMGLASVMTANNETGTVQDVKALAALAHARGALFHTDAVQAVGKIPVDVKELDVDFLTLSGHKLYGPKGIGALYVKPGAPFCPLIRGGHQERGRRAGTENTLGIVGLGAAAALRMQEMAGEAARLERLKSALRAGIKARIPDVQFNGHPAHCVPGTLNVSFVGAEGESILLYLDLAGVAVSTGSACASGSLDPSHVLLAMGLPAEQAHGSIRMSLGRDTTQEDIDYVLGVLPDVIGRIRGMSTAYSRRTT